MAPATARASSPSLDYADPVLAKLVETATFDCDWPTLRHHLYLALLATLPVFLEKGEPQPSFPRGMPVSLSPTNARAERTEDGRVHITSLEEDDPLRPSTPGGLVIPPFAPLDPDRPPGMRPGDGRLNGTPGRGTGNPFDEEWDPEVVIGGRKLPSWFDEEDGKRQVEKVAQRIEELSFAPFTVQRLAELLLSPTKSHSTLGKFLRAVEKTLNVTTAYAPPSYTYVPPPSLVPVETVGSPSSSPSPASMDIDSTVPPGSMTPMFSPIPWATGENDALGEPMMDVDDGHGDDGLMSPLMLSDGAGVFAAQQGQGRSPTPEPEDEGGMNKSPERGGGGEGAAGGSASGSGGAAAAESAGAGSGTEADSGDPGSQPYLGRVDELDSGPITSNGHHEDGERPPGVGETGNMTPHGMSEQPVPLSSTTVISENPREIAPLPRRGGVSAEGEGEPEDPVAEGDAQGEGVKEEMGAEGKAEEGGEGKADGEAKAEGDKAGAEESAAKPEAEAKEETKTE